MSDKKMYVHSVVENLPMSPWAVGYRFFRVEVWENSPEAGYAVHEEELVVPHEIGDKILEIFDGLESNYPFGMSAGVMRAQEEIWRHKNEVSAPVTPPTP